MSDSRLNRLAQLWAQGLEVTLAPAEESEIQGLLADAALAEAWVEKQSSTEEAKVIALILPSSLRGSFRRQFKPWSYWGLRLVLPALLATWFLWPQAEPSKALSVSIDNDPFQERVATPAEKADLGPPPGLGQVRHLWVSRKADAVSFEVSLARPGLLEARIFDAQNHPIQWIKWGQQPVGRAQIRWNGLAKDGRKAPWGRYRVEVWVAGSLSQENTVSIEKN